jgi:signal transduction histidine kinase
LRRRAFWFVRLRWFVPLIIGAGSFTAQAVGFVFNIYAIFGVAAFILLYNTFCYVLACAIHRRANENTTTRSLYFFTYLQVAFDYLSIFLLLHFTGGATSPLIFLFFFHIIFAAILLPEKSAVGFAGMAAAGMILMAFLDWTDVIQSNLLCFKGDVLSLPEKLWYLNAKLIFFVAAIFITALSASVIMKILKRQIIENAMFYDQAEQLTEERWRFMQKASHNLRAPLAAVISMLEVLKDEYLGPLTPRQREHLRRIHRRTSTMADMLAILMAIAKSRAKTRVTVPTPMLLTEIGSRIDRTFEDRAHLKGLELNITVPDALSGIYADLEVLEPIVENLISNAIKYTHTGEVRVTFATSDGFLKITVEDTGIGIPENDKAHLFEEFFRARNAKTVEEIGTGLGLAFVRETVSQQNGRIEWESEVGKGTRFDVYLPMINEPNAQP